MKDFYDKVIFILNIYITKRLAARSFLFKRKEGFSQRPLFPSTKITKNFHVTVIFIRYTNKEVFTTYAIFFLKIKTIRLID